MLNTRMVPFDKRHWLVYIVETQTSTYQLGIYVSARDHRRMAVLRGISASLGKAIEAQDSNPLIGGLPLFETSVEKWVNRRLEIGHTLTSPVSQAYVDGDVGGVVRNANTSWSLKEPTTESPVPTWLRHHQREPVLGRVRSTPSYTGDEGVHQADLMEDAATNLMALVHRQKDSSARPAFREAVRFTRAMSRAMHALEELYREAGETPEFSKGSKKNSSHPTTR